MRGGRHFTCLVAFTGCASSSSSPALESRVHALELELAELRGATVRQATPVPFDVGATSTRNGDRITIADVVGTRGDFAVGVAYIVRGERLGQV
jgi:hypothetical protein